jgi:hypothetical protein
VAWELAQFNIALGRWPLDDPRMADFVAQLDAVNALAEATPGFVWRLKGEAGAPSSTLQAYDDPRVLVNMSVWVSLDALRGYVYRGDHGHVFRDRHRWFEPAPEPSLVLWWVPAGRRPTVEEGKARLAALAAKGPCVEGFTFRTPFAAP